MQGSTAALCFHPGADSPAALWGWQLKLCVWETLQLVACQDTLTCLEIWVALKVPDSALNTGIFLFSGQRQPSGVTAPRDLIVPAAMYFMAGQDLRGKEKRQKFSNCLKKVSFCQASKVLFPVGQWLWIAASCTLIKWSCSVLGTTAFCKSCVTGPVNHTTKKLLVCWAYIVATFCLPSLSLSKKY